MARILFAGESWTIKTTHIKGVDYFTQWGYGEGVKWVKEALEEDDNEVVHLPNHLAIEHFPSSVEELKRYDCLILSDIGANTLLLHPRTANNSEITPNRLSVIQDYVASGGALIMIGGYMSYQGIEGKARYAKSQVEEVLPVTMMEVDDRVEVPQGFKPIVTKKDHPIIKNIPSEWPSQLFYNRVYAKQDSDIVLSYNQDPILVSWDYGEGRSVAFTPDAAPHGATPDFLNWKYFNQFWQQVINWLTKRPLD